MSCPNRPRRPFLFFWHVGQPHEWLFQRIYKFMPGVSQHFMTDERCIHCRLDRTRSFVEPDELLGYGYTSDQLRGFDTNASHAESLPMPAGNRTPNMKTVNVPAVPTNDDFDDIDNPAVLRGVIDAVYEGAAEWEKECRAAEKLLYILLTLKYRKETHGTDDPYYVEHKPKAWRMVHQHLKLYGYDVCKIPPPYVPLPDENNTGIEYLGLELSKASALKIEAERRYQDAEAKLLLLVRLKLYKDRRGQDSIYHSNIRVAWQRAIDHLKDHGYNLEADALLV